MRSAKPRPSSRPTLRSGMGPPDAHFEEVQQLRKECYLLEKELTDASLLTQRVSASQKIAESESQKAFIELQRARQNFATILSQLREVGSSHTTWPESRTLGGRGPEEVAHETSSLRDSLNALCRSLAEGPQKGQAWLEGVADVGGQVLMAMATMREVNQKLQHAELQVYSSNRDWSCKDENLGIMAAADADAKAQRDQAAHAIGSLKLQVAGWEQALLQEEVARWRGLLSSIGGRDAVYAASCMEQASELQGKTHRIPADMQRKNDTRAEVHFHQARMSAMVPAGPLFALVIQRLAQTQRWDSLSKVKLETWKSLMQSSTNRDKRLEQVQGSHDGNLPAACSTLAEVSPASIADRFVGYLEAQLSSISNQWHHATSLRCKLQMDLQALQSQAPTKTEAAAKQAAADMLRLASVWNHELLQRCAAWLSHADATSDWQDIAAVRELGLEQSLRDLAAMNQAARERIWSLEAEHENLVATAGTQKLSLDTLAPPAARRVCSGLQQHIDSLKSELGMVRLELCTVKTNCDEIEQKLCRTSSAPLAASDAKQLSGSPRNTGSAALAQVCPALTSITQQMRHIYQETDSQQKSAAFKTVLQELEHARAWCQQVQQELKQQAVLSEKILASSHGETSGRLHQTASSSSSRPFEVDDRSISNMPGPQSFALHLVDINPKLVRTGAVLPRVEALLKMQQGLQTGYRAVTQELQELQSRKQTHECLGSYGGLAIHDVLTLHSFF